MTREARWAGVEEVLNFAENYVRRSPEPTLDGFLAGLTHDRLAPALREVNENPLERPAVPITF